MIKTRGIWEEQVWIQKLEGTVCYPHPQELWNRTERDLEELYQRFNVPQMPDFEHKYLAALFAAMEKPFRTSGESTIFCNQISKAIWLLRLKTRQSSNYVSSLEIQLSILPWDRNRQLLEYIKKKSYSSQPCWWRSVGFYCRASNDLGDWSTVHCIRRVIDSGKWSTPAIVGGVAETTSQHHTYD